MAKDNFLDRLIGRLDSLDANNIQAYILRLSREKGFLDTIFNAIHEGVLVIDRRLKICYANKAAAMFLGLPENIEDTRISQFLRGVDWKLILKQDENEWYRISRQEIEVFYPHRRILNFYIVPHEGNRGEATVILRDVTELRDKTENQLESERFNSISLLAAGVAHEIGNPLNSLSLHLQLLQRQLKGGEELDSEECLELVDVARSEVERLDSIITQFLTAVRPRKIELAALNIKSLIVEALKFMRQEIEGRSIKVKCDWPDFLPNISGDMDQLKQAFYNIFKNAIQAMPHGGTINVTCVNEEDFVVIAIGDTGTGISPEKIGEIFDPYFTTKKEGSGLGLMIVERILRDHAAEFVVESEPGKGTVFTMKFPLHGKRMRLLPTTEVDEEILTSHVNAVEGN